MLLAMCGGILIIMNQSAEANTLFSVVIPAHNEGENLQILIPRLYAALSSSSVNFEIVMVDNASTDDTRAVITEFQKTMPLLLCVEEPTLGYGRTVLTGLRHAKGAYIGINRSDNQEKPEDLCRMYNKLRAGNISFYKGVRMHRINDGLMRLVVSAVYNTLFKVFFRLKSRDLNATPKIFTRAYLDAAHLESTDWFIDAEMVLKAEKLGFSVGEMGVEYLPRLKGKSSVRVRHVFEFLGNMIKWHSRIIHGQLLEK